MHAQMPEPITPPAQPGLPPDLPEFPSPINDPAPNDLPPLEMPPDGDPMGTPMPPQMRHHGRWQTWH